MLKPIAITATTAIKAPTAKTPSDILASRLRFWLAPALRICAGFALCADWGLGDEFWITRPPRALVFECRHALGRFGTEPFGNEFDTYDTATDPYKFAIALNTVLEQHQGESTG